MGSGPSAQTNLGRSKQRGWRFWAAVIVAILATIFIFQNIQSVEVVKSTAVVADGEIVEYRVDVKIGFEYEG